MATYYVWSGATGTNAGTSWTNAWTSLVSLPVMGSGDIAKVHTGSTSTHSQTVSANITLAGPSSGNPAFIVGVDKDNSDAYTESASDNLTTDTDADIVFDGSIAVYGIHFNSVDRVLLQAGDGNETFYFKDCRFDVQNDYLSNLDRYMRCQDCDFVLGTAGNMWVSDFTEIIGGTWTGTKGTVLRSTGGFASLIGVDLSGCTGGTLIELPTPSGIVNLIGCDIPIFTLSTTYYGEVNIYGSSTTAQNNQWRNERRTSKGGDVVVTESVYRDSGATYDGTNEYSYKLSANSSNSVERPVYTDWNIGYIEADSGTQTTWTVYIANTSADINNDDCFLEVEYYANSADTIKNVDTTALASPADTPAAITDDATETWTGITEFAQKMSITATVAKTGMYRWRAGSTFTTTDVYVCPKADVSQA